MGRRCGGSVSSRRPSRKIWPVVACSNPATMRSKVVLPEPLSPSSVRNSPRWISSEMDSSTRCAPKLLPTLSMRRKAGPAAGAAPLCSLLRSRAAGRLLNQPPAFELGSSLAGLYFVPYLGVLRAAPDILPEDDLFLVGVDVVE